MKSYSLYTLRTKNFVFKHHTISLLFFLAKKQVIQSTFPLKIQIFPPLVAPPPLWPNATTLAAPPSDGAADVSCPPLFPPHHGYLECSRPLERVGDGDRINNRPGSQCVLRCPTGYRVEGAFEKICDFNGRWIGREGGQCLSECCAMLNTYVKMING